jgi:hypothetical protein
MPEQDARGAGVLGRDHVGRREHVERTQRQVAQVPERRRDHI